MLQTSMAVAGMATGMSIIAVARVASVPYYYGYYDDDRQPLLVAAIPSLRGLTFHSVDLAPQTHEGSPKTGVFPF